MSFLFCLFAEIITELYTTSSSATITSSSSKSMTKSLTETQLKCSSLPPGLAAPGSDANKLNRSRSNAGSKYQDEFSTLGEEDETKDNKKTDNFFVRTFPRRSAKKRKSKEEKSSTVSLTTNSVLTTTSVMSSSTNKAEILENAISKEYSHSQEEKRIESSMIEPIPVPRTGAASRRRIQPHDIPASPELGQRFEEITFKSSPDRSNPVSPLHIELENHLL